VINANRGKVLYLLLTNPATEEGRQAALDAQRLLNAYSLRDVALVYVPIQGSDALLWPEFATRYNLFGDHLLLTDNQLMDITGTFRANDEQAGLVVNRTGKIVKRNAPLPGAFDELKEILNKYL
jgi:biotin-(acetyl-CoA carboxylase) ligase